MATQLPAFKGAFGNTDFWLVTMKASELTNILKIPKELDEWENLSVEEKYQREINYGRVAREIAPYLANERDRFFGAFIVEVRNHEKMKFQSLKDSGLKVPLMASEEIFETFGVIQLSGEELLVPLDGQHRLCALRFAMTGKNEKGQDLDFKANEEVGRDTCTVILVKRDLEKGRKIFNKVNKYAKTVSKADKLLTDDDDYIAVINRKEICGNNDPIVPGSVINEKSNTLSDKSHDFTTLATIYEISKKVEEHRTGRKLNLTTLPADKDIALAVQNIRNFWKEFVRIEEYESSLHNTSSEGGQTRSEIRKQSLACKPIVQRVIAETILHLTSQDQVTAAPAPSQREIVDRINKLIDWDPEKDLWQGILRNGEKIIAGVAPLNFAVRMLCYLLGEELGADLEKLKETWGRNNPSLPFPEKIYSEK